MILEDALLCQKDTVEKNLQPLSQVCPLHIFITTLSWMYKIQDFFFLLILVPATEASLLYNPEAVERRAGQDRSTSSGSSNREISHYERLWETQTCKLPVKIDPLALVQAIERYLIMRGYGRLKHVSCRSR